MALLAGLSPSPSSSSSSTRGCLPSASSSCPGVPGFCPNLAAFPGRPAIRRAPGRAAAAGGARRARRAGTGGLSVRAAATAAAAAAAAEESTEELPAKLKEIVALFQQVDDPRAKYEQLLHYAKRLRPLPKELCTGENKVEGCVSQVWVRVTLDDGGAVALEAESDSLLTKGLAALLVEGLSGAAPAEVLRVTPEFVQMLGLKQSLTPSRSNGFLNMLKLVQKKTLQVYMQAEAGSGRSRSAGRTAVAEEPEAAAAPVRGMETPESGRAGESRNGANFASGSGSAQEDHSMKSAIEKKLQEALSPTVLVVDDVSHQHAGHAGVHRGATETHFNIKVVSDKFTGSSLIKRHRLIYNLLDYELKNGIHALSLVTKSPSEPG